MLDFGALPPELTSTLMYAGPGAESMLAAATAWDGLAAELQSAATSYGSVITGLANDAWVGPSSTAMATAAVPVVNWMSGAAGQARAAAGQARAAATGYEAAFAAVVAPPVIVANRAQLATLLAANIFGQHTAAIAVLETQYAQMWAQDAAAMYGYAASSAAATRLTPFTAAPQTTNPAGPAAAAAAQAVGTSAGGAQSAVTSTGLLGVIPQLLSNLGTAGTQATSGLGQFLDGGTGLSGVYSNAFNLLAGVMKFDGIGNAAMSVPNFGMVEFKTFFKPLELLPEIPKSALGAGLGGSGMAALGPAITGPTSPLAGGLIRAVTADVGTAPSVGALSVPQGWATTTPAIRLAATSLSTTSLAAAPMAADLSGVLNPAALGSLTGGALGSPGSRLINGSNVRGGTVGKGRQAPVQLDKVIAQLQKQKDSVQHWQIDEAGLDDLLEELSKKPGFHAVHLTKGPKADKPDPAPTKSQLG